MLISQILHIAAIRCAKGDNMTVEAAVRCACSLLLRKDGIDVKKEEIYLRTMAGLKEMGFEHRTMGYTFAQMEKTRKESLMFLLWSEKMAIEQGV